MEFELSPEVFDQIIFAMEDQSANPYIHRKTGQLVPQLKDDIAEFVRLPPWTPVDGFYLMEAFISTVSNRRHQQQLRTALAAGRGVFRSFKNALKQSRDLERRWYRFKEKEMRRVVADWYNREREAAGLERLGPEPEETDDLTISDFFVAPASPGHVGGAHMIDLEALTELRQVSPHELAGYLEGRRRELEDPRSRLVVACTPKDEVVGMAWAREGGAAEWELIQLAVMPYYRGLGLATRLLQVLADQAEQNGVATLRACLDAGTLDVRGLLEKVGFRVDTVQLSFPCQAPARTVAPG